MWCLSGGASGVVVKAPTVAARMPHGLLSGMQALGDRQIASGAAVEAPADPVSRNG